MRAAGHSGLGKTRLGEGGMVTRHWVARDSLLTCSNVGKAPNAPRPRRWSAVWRRGFGLIGPPPPVPPGKPLRMRTPAMARSGPVDCSG
eukprot:scaffold12027_cov104-Isochrysis_galbana.AAC.6